MKSFLEFLGSELKNKDNGLGDRSSYVGASDIGQCLKKTYLGKFQSVEHSLQQLLVFERGHLGESLVRNVLTNSDIKFREQVELCGMEGFEFIRAHIDFLIETSKEVLIIEVKTVDSTPEEPYVSWAMQVQLQMWLAVQAFKKKVRAKILAWNTGTGEMKEWDLTPSDELMALARDRASSLWVLMKNEEEPKGEPDHLCSFCPFKDRCQELKHGAQQLPEDVGQMALDLASFNRSRKDASKKREAVIAFFENAGIKKGQYKGKTISVSNFQSEEMDTQKFKNDESLLYEKYKKTVSSYRVNIY